jgi:iron-sulfur cluster assembly protein
MLTITDNAATVVKDLTGRATGSPAGGLRISASETDALNFDVAMIPAPEAEDQVVENDGAHVFLEKSAAEALADKELDAIIDDEGAVRFSVLARA